MRMRKIRNKFDNTFGGDLMGFRKPLKSKGPQGSPGGLVSMTYAENLSKGMSPKDAAKQAQLTTGLSAVTGKPIQTRGIGWQSY